MNRILAYELADIVFIIFLGSLLHFTFEFSGGNRVVCVFSAVNESIWEHLKLAFWPAVLFALIELVPLKRVVNNFWLSKTVSIYFMVALIPVIFYAYTAFTGQGIFAVDIASFVVAVIIGQLISYKLLTHRKLASGLNWAALVLLIVLAVIFIVFTFTPPHLQIFQDPITGGYGIA
jgi:hypothetical protein